MQKFTNLRNDPPAKKISYKTMLAVLLGNVFEFYCFILFIVLAPYIGFRQGNPKNDEKVISQTQCL